MTREIFQDQTKNIEKVDGKLRVLTSLYEINKLRIEKLLVPSEYNIILEQLAEKNAELTPSYDGETDNNFKWINTFWRETDKVDSKNLKFHNLVLGLEISASGNSDLNSDKLWLEIEELGLDENFGFGLSNYLSAYWSAEDKNNSFYGAAVYFLEMWGLLPEGLPITHRHVRPGFVNKST